MDDNAALADLRHRYVRLGKPLCWDAERRLKADGRPGAIAILEAVSKRRSANRSEGQRLRKLLRYETALWDAGLLSIAGVDEAGMSPLAGPVAAAAVVLAPGTKINGIDDSKKLDAASREELAAEIKRLAVCWSVAFTKVEEWPVSEPAQRPLVRGRVMPNSRPREAHAPHRR